MRDFTVTYEHFRCACGKHKVPVSVTTGYAVKEPVRDGEYWHTRHGCVTDYKQVEVSNG